jgi:hypothetical protein
MRRITFFTMGILECAAALVLVILAAQLPSRDEIAAGFQSAERVTSHAGRQVQIFRRQVQELRRPELQQLAERLQSQTLNVTANIKRQQIDFDTVQTMRDALNEIAASLTGLATTLEQAEGKDKQQTELRLTLERSAGLLKTSSQQLSQALEQRDGYEETLRQSVAVAETFAATLPLLTEQLDGRLAEEELALNELESSLGEVRAALPIYARTSVMLLQGGRLLTWLAASIAMLHACYLMMSAWLAKSSSA